jgi:signal transduction histidine kinase
LLLILKEALSNVARHAQATRVEIAIRLAGPQLTLSIEDDGRGFDPEGAHAGHGLNSLRQRAAALSAQLEIRSTPGRGTRVSVVVPL